MYTFPFNTEDRDRLIRPLLDSYLSDLLQGGVSRFHHHLKIDTLDHLTVPFDFPAIIEAFLQSYGYSLLDYTWTMGITNNHLVVCIDDSLSLDYPVESYLTVFDVASDILDHLTTP